MSKNSLSPVIEILENLFSKFNQQFFENKLSKPVITVSPDTTKGAYGWCTGWKAWVDGGDDTSGYYEINMCAEYISRPFTDICGTLLHEMIHLYNLENNIKDTSRGGTYHNKRFKESAEKHGLICELSEKYGYSFTTPTDETLLYFNSLNFNGFNIYRAAQNKKNKPKQSVKKYFCPLCGTIIRATKEVSVICADCDTPFELEVE